jgi:hypothetical protein
MQIVDFGRRIINGIERIVKRIIIIVAIPCGYIKRMTLKSILSL